MEWNPSTKEVDAVVSVCSYNYDRHTITDLTEIFQKHFDLDAIVDGIDWEARYAEIENIQLEESEY